MNQTNKFKPTLNIRNQSNLRYIYFLKLLIAKVGTNYSSWKTWQTRTRPNLSFKRKPLKPSPTQQPIKNQPVASGWVGLMGWTNTHSVYHSFDSLGTHTSTKWAHPVEIDVFTAWVNHLNCPFSHVVLNK